MIKRIYLIEELSESAEMLQRSVPWWLHGILFGLIILVLLSASIISVTMPGKNNSNINSTATINNETKK